MSKNKKNNARVGTSVGALLSSTELDHEWNAEATSIRESEEAYAKEQQESSQPSFIEEREDILQEADVIIEQDIIIEDEILDENTSLDFLSEATPLTVNTTQEASISNIQAALNATSAVTAQSVAQIRAKKQTEQTIDGLVQTKTRGYSEKGSNIPQNYLPIAGETVIRNGLQADITTKLSRVHANTILMETLGITQGHKQVKLSEGNWATVYDQNFDFAQITNAQDYKLAEDFGFKFNTETKIATWKKEDANVKNLLQNDPAVIQDLYNRIYTAANKSHDLNSKNNLFTSGKFQTSSFLLELNKVVEEYCEQTEVNFQ